jgi:hypothetical protein
MACGVFVAQYRIPIKHKEEDIVMKRFGLIAIGLCCLTLATGILFVGSITAKD